ncbi:SOUL heme-binding family protein [Striga asiatica]|uniref:SOUL heme-binding family protein n=1 Tax=Striga asiatica TaxID=4170 RepID=A0A5A7QPQ5_STRAF|nr:SOUL heme-binding family protein [Striga asiatica]
MVHTMSSPRNTLYFLFVMFVVLLQGICKVTGRGFFSSSQYNNGQGYKPAPNCARFECASYVVVHSQKEFEIRKYEKALWVSAPSITMDDYKSAASKGFLILFSYYNGNNTEKVKMNLTIPVLIDVKNTSYTVYFRLPKEYQNTMKLVPKPINKNIQQVTLPKHKFAAVTRYSGNITNKIIPVEVAKLNTSLMGTPYQAAASAVGFNGYTIAAYNSPFELKNRVNEVLFFYD